MNDNGKNSSNERKAASILILALLSVLWIARESLPITQVASSVDNIKKNYTQYSTSSTAKRPNVEQSTTTTKPSSSVNQNIKSNSNATTSQTLPILLLEASTNSSYITTWGDIATGWNRTAQYEELIQNAKPIPSLPIIDKSAKRPVVIIHCGPKTGSTTLRTACKRNYEKTCGIFDNKRDPQAYLNTTGFYPLVRSCPDTYHFCAKNITMPLDVPTFEDTQFIHMFPFRNYDEWAKSALKQQFDRGREKECAKREKQMFEKNCKPSSMELDFRKYGKTDLSMYKEYVVKRMNQKSEKHMFLLYHHRELNDVLELLSDLYKIPTLPGSNGHEKDERPEGTCDDKLLDKFHECFSSKLMELP